MDDLERALRGVLTDDRLDVATKPGAVTAIHQGVRRRSRRRAVATVGAAAVVVTAGGAAAFLATRSAGDGRESVVPGGGHPQSASSAPTAGPKPTIVPVPGGRSSAVVDWADLPVGAFVVPGSLTDPTVPWCSAHGVTVTAGAFQGATGSAAGGVAVVNHGAACALQGPPAITGYGAGDQAIAMPTQVDGFVLHAWFVLEPGHRAISSVQIFGDASRCQGPVTRLQVDLGHGIPTADVTPRWVTGGGVQPRCGSVPPPQQADYYTVSASDWTRPDGTPTLGTTAASVELQHEPRTVMQGTILRYDVVMSGKPSLDPCTPYRERLESLGTQPTVLAEEDHSLNCRAIRIMAADASTYVLRMQLAVPTDAPPGGANLVWETPLPGQVAGDGPTVRIVAAPPPCTQSQLSITSGGMGVAAGSYYGRVIITNTSGRTCSLHGYPGVQFVDSAGHPVTTDARRDATTAVQTVVLAAHRGAASFLVSGSDFAPPGGSRPCAGTEGLRVIAPNLTTQVLVRGVASNCQHGYIRVYPVVPGRNANP